MFFYQELYFDSLMSQNKLVQYIANSIILKSDIILLLISNNKEADGFFFFLRNGFHARAKGCTNHNDFFFWKLFLLVAYLDQNLQCLKGLYYMIKGQTFNGIEKIRDFITFYVLAFQLQSGNKS